MRNILWWGTRIAAALLSGAGTAALTGSAIFGAIATGVVVLVVAGVAWEAYANRGNAAYGNRLVRSGGAADGVPYVGAGQAGSGAGDGCGGAGGYDGGSGFDGGGGGFGGDGGGGGGGGGC